MAKTLTYDMEGFRAGLHLLEDDSVAPVGSARRMLNVLITDRGGISVRPGTKLLGARNTDGLESRGFTVFKKSFGAKEIPVKVHGGRIDAYHPTAGWFMIKNGFQFTTTGDGSDEEFDFVSSLVNTDNEDFIYFCNRYQPYQRWNGQIALLTAPVLAAATTIPVDSTIEEDVFISQTASANSTTTVDIATSDWVVDQWKNFFIHIVSGAQAGKVRKITSNTANQLTFAALPGAPGNVPFEIVMSKFNLSVNDKFIYNEQTITVTGIDTATSLTVASAHAAPSGTAITNAPQEYAAAPRGNRLETLIYSRVFVGNVRSALSRDSGGALQGSNSAGSVFVSKRADPKDFGFSAARVAGEGDIISFPYGGGDITDITVMEEVAYIYKRTLVSSVQYTQDINDVAVVKPIKSGVGSVGRVIQGRDDHFFYTVDKQFTSIGRLLQKDTTVQTDNIGLPIKRLLETYDFTTQVGTEFRNRILSAVKSSSAEGNNNVILVWNQTTKSFEGVWSLGGRGFGIYQEKMHMINSYDGNVVEMFTDKKSDIAGADEFPITAVWESNFFNLLPMKGHIQGINSVALEGYITEGSKFTYKLFKDFSSTPAVEFDFGGLSDSAFLLGDDLATFLGANPLGLSPIGTIDAPGQDGRRRFSFLVYFPWTYGQYFSVGLSSEGKNQDWEVLRNSLGLKESISTVRPGVKLI